MKLKDILLKLATAIGSDPLKDIAGNNTFDEFDIDDSIGAEISDSFNGLLTLDAAKNNPEIIEHVKSQIHKPLKKSIMSNIDESIANHTKKTLGEDAFNDISGIESTAEKINKFMELSQDFIQRNAKDPKSQEVVTGLKQQIKELNDQIASVREESENKITEIKTGYEDQLVNTQLKSILSTYKLGSDYTKQDFIRNALYDNVLKELKEKTKPKFDPETGRIIPLNPEGEDLPLYINNKKVDDIKVVLDDIIDPYIDKTPGKEKAGTYKPSTDEVQKSSLAKDLESKRQEMFSN